MTTKDITPQILELGRRLAERAAWLGVAESCTGGLIGHMLTNVSGSSQWFAGGIIAYANRIKTDRLGVPEAVLAEHGAVSEACVLAMAAGARTNLPADWALAVSGIAGPTGGTPDKPVGTVWMAWAGPAVHEATRMRFEGDRLAVKEQAAEAAILGLLERVVGEK
jgi:nicotinamide-nucleotide amidase